MEQQEFYQTEQQVTKKKSGLATAGMVLGIIGVCLSFIPIVNNACFFLGALAIIFGIIALLKKRSIAKSITAVICGILAIAITLAMQAAVLNAIDDAFDDFDEDMDYLSGEKTNEILEKYLDVSIGKFQVIEYEYYNDCKLEVTIKNKSEEKASFEIKIEAIDNNGNRIESDTIYANDLGAGQSQKFDIFTLITSDKYSDMQGASFKVFEASMY